MPNYVMKLRPASFCTLPEGVAWEYVECPSYITMRPDLPRSRHPHGVIKTDRALTADELKIFDIEAVADAEANSNALRPFCDRCGWRKGGPDSWDGVACKCGHTEPPLETTGMAAIRAAADAVYQLPEAKKS